MSASVTGDASVWCHGCSASATPEQPVAVFQVGGNKVYLCLNCLAAAAELCKKSAKKVVEGQRK